MVGTTAALVGAAGIGASLYGAKKSGEAGEIQRNPGQEVSGFFSDPKNWQSYLDFQSSSAKNAGNQQLGVAQQSLGLYPQINTAQTSGQTQTRQANLADLQQFGGNYMQTMQGMSPLFNSSLSSLNGMVAGAGSGSGDMGQMLNASVMGNLAKGSGLSDQQLRDVTQATRAGLADRGMAMGNNALGAELLSRDAYGQQLLAQRQATAMGLQQQNQNFTLGAAQAGQNSMAPALSFLGQPAVNVGMATQFLSPTAALGSADAAGRDMLGFMSGANNWNANAQLDAARSQANMFGALGGSLLGAAGNLGGYGINANARNTNGMQSNGKTS